MEIREIYDRALSCADWVSEVRRSLHRIPEEGFREFLEDGSGDPLKKEYLLPTIVDRLIREGRARVKVLETQDKWFGITYKEDKPAVEEAFRQLVENGVYPENLWGK